MNAFGLFMSTPIQLVKHFKQSVALGSLALSAVSLDQWVCHKPFVMDCLSLGFKPPEMPQKLAGGILE